MTFSVDVSKWVEKANLNNEEVVRSTAIKLFSAIIQSSPVDEGTFRNNWFVSGLTPSSEVDPTDVGGSDQDVIDRMTSDVLSIKGIDAFTLTNNLPYAEVIEYGGYPKTPKNTTSVFGANVSQTGKTINGFSKQAPQGVVRVNAMRFQNLIDEEARSVRNS